MDICGDCDSLCDEATDCFLKKVLPALADDDVAIAGTIDKNAFDE